MLSEGALGLVKKILGFCPHTGDNLLASDQHHLFLEKQKATPGMEIAVQFSNTTFTKIQDKVSFFSIYVGEASS